MTSLAPLYMVALSTDRGMIKPKTRIVLMHYEKQFRAVEVTYMAANRI
jgi:hypothetical protein